MVISFTMPWAHLRYILLKANVKQLIHKPMLYVINDFVYSKNIQIKASFVCNKLFIFYTGVKTQVG